MLFSNTGKLFFVSQIGTGIIAKIWYPPGNLSGYIDVEAPPIPTFPFGVHVRGGLYFGTVSLHLGSRAIINGRPGQKPIAKTQYSVPECTLTNCSVLSRLFNSVISSGSGFFFAILLE